MKITSLTLYTVKPRWVFLKVDTDEGLSGWGEPTLEGKPNTSIAAVNELERHLIGQDPTQIERLFQQLYRGNFYRGGEIQMSAISGIEQALWDIKGKVLGVPVYDLIGGAVRDKIKVYAWIGGDDPEKADQDAKKRLEQGFLNLKMNATGPCERIGDYAKLDAAVERLARVRAAVGDNVGIAIDFHGRVHKTMAKTLVKQMEPYRPLFYEEPLLPEHLDFLPELARYTTIPLATGERLYGRWAYKQLISQGTIDIVQPDLSHTGGIWEGRKIAAMAEAYDMGVAPHCPLGPLALASSLQLDACTPNFVIQEASLKMQYNQSGDVLDYIKNKKVFNIQNGYIDLPKKPGLGLDIDEEAVIDADKEGFDWASPTDWHYEDGSIAEW